MKSGMPPGTMIYVGNKEESAPVLTLVEFDKDHFEEKKLANAEEVSQYLENDQITWLNVDGINNVGSLQRIGELFGLHPLVLEDLVNTHQRAKCEEYPEHIFFVLRMFQCNDNNDIFIEQVSIVIGKDYVISFQETEGDIFDPIRDRIRNGKGRVRSAGSDYLAYALIDLVIDQYFHILEQFETALEKIEDELVESPSEDTLKQIYEHRRDAMELRRSIWPLREAISNLSKTQSPLLAKETLFYLRDATDHTVRVIDAIELYRETVATMTEIYLSSMSERLNQQTKFLTIIATIFIPLTFIAGIYGMNFRHMPELNWKYGYLLVLLLMGAIATGMLLLFRKKNWI